MRSVFRIAEKSDISQIAALWQEAFGDSRESVEEFFRTFPNCLSYVAQADGEVLAMVHALPQILSPHIQTAYLYAVATKKTHRGKGLCRKLMAFAEADLQSRGFAACVLTPGEPSLFGFYEKLGYETAFFRHRTAFPGGTPISLETYLRRRETLVPVAHMVYDKNTLSYAQKLYGLTFYETATGMAAAGETYTAEVLPEDVGGEPFAMVKWLSEKQPLNQAYLGIPLE